MNILNNDKRSLTSMYDGTKHLAKPSCHNSRDNLINDSTTRDRPIMFDHVSCGCLGNEGHKGTIDFLIHFLY